MFKKTFFFMLLMALLMPWAANAQQSLPYEEGFEDYGSGLPTGWTKVGSGTVTVTSPTAANVHTGAKCLRFSGATSNVVALPQFTSETNTLQITFFTRPEGTYSASKDFDIGYITDLSDASTFVAIETYNYANFNGYLEKGPVFMTTAPDGAYIAFRHRPSSSSYYWFVDDVKVESIPSCPKPTLGDAQNISEEGASFQWTENGSATEWVLQYSTNEDFSDAISKNRSDIPALAISDLTPLTTYYVRVKADCGGGEQSVWSNVVNFTTAAVAQNVGDSWADDFEGTTCGWGFINGSLTNKWCWGEAVNNGGTHALYVSNDNGVTNNYASSNTKIFATKLLSFTEGKYEFAFDWLCKGENNYDFLRVALVPSSITLTAGSDYSTIGTTSLPAEWIAVDGGSQLNLQTTWQTGGATINVTAGNYYLVLAWRNDSGVNNPAASVDNMSITKINCDQDVTDLTVNDITTNSATLSWEGGEATQWQVAYSTSNSFEGATEMIVDENTYDMTGLNGSTTYYVRVRAYCGGEDFGSWANLPSFTTDCEALDLSTADYTENFDDITSSSTYTPSDHYMPNCWNVINDCTYSSYMYYPTVSSYGSNSNSGSNCLRFYTYYSSYTNYDPQDQYAILPPMEDLAGKQVILWAKGNAATSTFKIGTMTNFTDASTFVAFTEQALTTSYQQFEYIIPADAEGNYLAIMIEAANSDKTSNGVYIDDITIANAPTCVKPTNLAVTETTGTTATFSWTNDAENQTAWQICLNGDETNLIMTDSNPFTVEDLTPSTAYTVKVRAYCGEDDQSDWSNMVNFFTACEAITITEDYTFSESFEAYTGVAYNSNGEVPVCWTSYSTGSVAPHVIGQGTGNYVYVHEGSKALTFYGQGYCYATMPEFTNAFSELEIKFWMQTENANNGTLILGYITAEDEDYNTFTEIETYENHNNSMVQRSTILSEVPEEAARLVFRWYHNSQWSCCIDDVEVRLIPSCLTPTAFEATHTTSTTATFSWTAGADETAWQIMLNDDETNLIDVDSNPFTVENLTASTSYTAKVRAYCSDDNQSDWSNEITFETRCEAIVVDAANPFTEDFEGDWTPLCWESIPYVSGSSTRQWTQNTSKYHDGSHAAYSGYYGPIYLVMPDMELGTDGDAAQLTFWSYNTYASDYEKNSVVLIDGEDEIELWSPESVAEQWEETTIDLTDYMGQSIRLAFKYEGNNSHGWYVDEVQVAMVQSYTLTINGYEDDTNEGGYYLIASPVTVDLTNHDMTTGDFDLYYFDQAQDKEWINYEGENGNFSLEPGKGYLYAHKTGGDFILTGTPYSGDGVIDLEFDSNATDFQGWNLVGNPWGVKASPNCDFYTMNDGGSGIDVTPNVAGTEVNPMTGIFVVTDGENNTVTFEKENTGNKSANLALNLTNSDKLVDRAIVRFGEGRQLPKFQLNRNHTKVYIPQNGKEMAVVSSEAQGEMPVNFKAEKNGTYTFSANAEKVNFSYLHLIDNMTGNDVDLLATPSYSFEATTNDYANRFKLVYAASNNEGHDDFAFISNGMLIVNGTGTLQVIDLLGRTIVEQRVETSYYSVSTTEMVPGVYVLHLMNGNDVKTQKIVVE